MTSITSDKYHRLWFGTIMNGLLCLDTGRGAQVHFKHRRQEERSLISNRILSLFTDSKGCIWVGTEDKGVCYYDDNKGFVRLKSFPEICVHCFSEDAEGNIWIGTENGLYIYSPETQSLNCYRQDYSRSYSLNDNSIHAIIRDEENNMLLGTYFGGINIYPHAVRRFLYYEPGNGLNYLSGKAVRQIIGDKSQNLWIATEDGGLNFYDSHKKQFEHYLPRPGNSISYHNVHSLLIDRNEQLWIGTYLGGLNKYNPRNKIFTHYRKKEYPHLAVDNIFSLLEDRDGQIWIGTTGGISILNPQKDSFSLFQPDIFRYVSIDNLLEDSKGYIWIATRSKGVFCFDKQRQKLKNFSKDHIIDSYINYLYEDQCGYLWFGLQEGGLCKYDPATESFASYTKKDGLPSNTVYGIVEDNDRNLWISTDNGLSCFNPSDTVFTNYSVSDGLPNKQFNYNSVYKDSSGMLYFGTINGMVAFHPHTLQQTYNVARVEFTDLRVLGKSVKPDEKSSPLRKSIGDVDEIRLTSEQAQSFGFDFTVITINHSSSTGFAVKFGQDENWSYIGLQNHVTFVQQPPGEYRFMVKAAFNNKWAGNEPVKTMKIVILPPPALSPPAFVLYAVMLFALLFVFYSRLKRRRQERNAVLADRREKEKIKEINALKLSFFTNISHELRTPLSLILSPLQALLEKHEVDEPVESKISKVLKNAVRMNTLIDELVLFSKIENEQEKIGLRRDDILSFVDEICANFQVIADEKSLEYTVSCFSEKQEVWFDPVKVEKILYNLLSNAFKYTEHGAIRILYGLEKSGEYIYLRFSVSDTGIGIPPDRQERIFEYYNKVNDFTHGHKTGFGIGLALVKKLVLMHKGTIGLTSALDQGSSFSISLNVSQEAYSPDEISGKSADMQVLGEYQFLPVVPGQAAVDDKKNTPSKRYSILTVDDNVELLQFYEELFLPVYLVLTATNGDEAYQLAIAKIPDIIVCDIMMPGMNGYELSEKIKSDINTCHIPLILLTAKTGKESQMEAYDCGADMFIEKPFNPSLLLKQVANLIATKENQKKLFLKNQIGIEEIVSNSRDKALIDKVQQYILKHLHDSDLSIEQIIREVGVSRTLLYMKLKNITGLSATEFINNVRLKESLKILLSDGNVAEAAYSGGFGSPNYYSRCFKKHFGISPQEYANKMKQMAMTIAGEG
ncbi:MAG: response regulator [Dysgonamonadaceae bacterium]|nr:response regulator [Dysgonamonadaceae bacterium]